MAGPRNCGMHEIFEEDGLARSRLQDLDSIRGLISRLPEPCEDSRRAAQARQTELTKPPGSLGRLEEIAAFLAAWQSKPVPSLERPLVVVFAANHGVVGKGVSAYPASVTRAMVDNFAADGAAINQICKVNDLGLKIIALALDDPSKDITEAPALSEEEVAASFAAGMEAVPADMDLLCLGEMGIGNTTVAAAIYHGLYGGEASGFVGRGTGVDAEGFARKTAAVTAAVAHHKEYLNSPLEVLRRLGGREIAAIAGAIIGARRNRIPVVLDGYVVCAAAAIVHAANNVSLDHCLAGHVSGEGAHRDVLRRLGKAPLLDLGMRLGEGTGAALAFAIIKAAVACHGKMATFAEAKIASRNR